MDVGCEDVEGVEVGGADEEGGREAAADDGMAEEREGVPLEAGGCVCVNI